MAGAGGEPRNNPPPGTVYGGMNDFTSKPNASGAAPSMSSSEATGPSQGKGMSERPSDSSLIPILTEQIPHLRRYALVLRSEEHTSELQSLMRISYAVFCLTTTNHQA